MAQQKFSTPGACLINEAPNVTGTSQHRESKLCAAKHPPAPALTVPNFNLAISLSSKPEGGRERAAFHKYLI